MKIKIFSSIQKNIVLLGTLGLSLFSFTTSMNPIYASNVAWEITNPETTAEIETEAVTEISTEVVTAAITETVAEVETEVITEAENNDFIIIDDLIFQKSASSPETLAAYESYQKAIAYQNEWNMMLVNKDHPLKDDYTFTQKRLPGYSMTVDERIYEPLLTMLDAGKKEGCRFLICSAYRSYTRQTQIYNSHISNYRARGYSYEKAKELTELSIAVPGSSEHQTGMAVDIVATYYQQLNDNFANTKEAQWLKAHAHEYGFILRYPKDKTAITQITFEPWHFRYVGKEAASEIYELGVCYEEYISMKEQAAMEALEDLRIQVEFDNETEYAHAREYYSKEYWYWYSDTTDSKSCIHV